MTEEERLYQQYLYEKYKKEQAWAEDHPDAPAVVTEKNDPSIGDMFAGAFETAATLLSGATAGTLGQVAGTAKGVIDVAMDPELDFFTTDPERARQATDHIAQTAGDWGDAVTYSPRTATGQQYATAVGEAMGPLEAMEGHVMGGGMTAAGRASNNRSRAAATRAMENPRDSVAAGDRIVYDNRGVPMHIANDADSRTAMARLGIPPEMMNQFKYATPETRQAMIEMVQRGQARMGDSELPGARTVMGEYIGGRANLAQTAMRKHGKAIDEASLSRQGTNVQTGNINAKYNALLEKQRVKVNDDGTLNFEGSRVPKSARGQLQEIHDRMSKYGKDGVGDFDELHNYKQYLSDIASYDRRETGGSAGVQQIVKGLRREINETLGENAPDYRAANKGYAEIADPMRKILKAAKENVDDLTDAEVVEMFSLKARGLANNTQGGVTLKAAMEAINKAIKNNADMFTPEDFRSAGLSDVGDVTVRLQNLADLGSYTDRLLPDKPGSFGVLTSEAGKNGPPTKANLLDDVYNAGKTMVQGGEETVAVNELLKKQMEMRLGFDGLLGVLGRDY